MLNRAHMQSQRQDFGVSVCTLTDTKYPTSSLGMSVARSDFQH